MSHARKQHAHSDCAHPHPHAIPHTHSSYQRTLPKTEKNTQTHTHTRTHTHVWNTASRTLTLPVFMTDAVSSRLISFNAIHTEIPFFPAKAPFADPPPHGRPLPMSLTNAMPFRGSWPVIRKLGSPGNAHATARRRQWRGGGVRLRGDENNRRKSAKTASKRPWRRKKGVNASYYNIVLAP